MLTHQSSTENTSAAAPFHTKKNSCNTYRNTCNTYTCSRDSPIETQQQIHTHVHIHIQTHTRTYTYTHAQTRTHNTHTHTHRNAHEVQLRPRSNLDSYRNSCNTYKCSRGSPIERHQQLRTHLHIPKHIPKQTHKHTQTLMMQSS